MEQHHETIIVGGGMAGMFCALKLKEAGKPFLLISDRLGGRTYYKEEFKMNFGAVFYFENYHNVRKILTSGPVLIKSIKQIMLHLSETDYYPAFSFRMLKNLPQLIKFKRFMKQFIKHYEVYKKNCETMQVKDALKKDPFMEQLFFKSAQQLINELKIGRACSELVSQFVYGCTGAKVHTLTALDFCNCAQGLVMPICQFAFDENAMQRRLGSVELDSVVKVDKESGQYKVTTAKGVTYTARNLVLATPAGVTKTLIKLPKIRSASTLFAYLVKGTIKEKYRHNDLHCFADTIPIIFVAKRQNGKGEYEVFSNARLNLNKYFDEHSVLHVKEWPEALYTHPAIVLDQDLGDNLYMAGDHNGLGMEPAAISGIYTANQIIKKAAAGR
ncbi:FAD-dependent oxidoreductase [Oryzomonas rubra]|nr:FAD-dependent oxidoreductase [Oryzomonas rubra]